MRLGLGLGIAGNVGVGISIPENLLANSSDMDLMPRVGTPSVVRVDDLLGEKAWFLNDNASGFEFLNQQVELTAGVTYCFSIHVLKDASTQYGGISFFDGTSDFGISYTPSASGVVTRTGGTLVDSGETDLGAVKRVWFSFTPGGSGSRGAVIAPAVATTATGTWSANAQGSMIVVAPQVEVGSSPTEYMPT